MNIEEVEILTENECSTVTFELDSVDELNGNVLSDEACYVSVCQLNIRSVSKNLDDFLILLEQIKSRYDILILSETWEVDDFNVLSVPGYIVYYSGSKYNQNDGTIAFIKENISHTVTLIKKQQIVFMKISCSKKSLNYDIFALYRPPSTDIDLFFADLSEVLREHLEKSNTTIFTGDININILDPLSSDTNHYLNILHTYNFVYYLSTPTRGNACLDHFFVKCSSGSCDKIEFAVLKYHITDHFPIFLKLYGSDLQDTHELLPEHKIVKKINYESLRSKLNSQNWECLYKNESVNDSTEIFLSILLKHINDSTVTKKVTIKKKHRSLKPWMSFGLVVSIRKREKMYREYSRDINNLELKEKLRKYRNMLNVLIRNAKNFYYKSQLDESFNNVGKLWRIVNQATGRESKREMKIEKVVNNDGDQITDHFDISNHFNTYFCGIGANMAEKIKKSNKSTYSNIKHKWVKQSLFLSPITEREIFNQIQSLRANAAPGPDAIQPNTLKQIASQILKPLEYILNLSMMKGEFPIVFKQSIVSPIFKKGSKVDVGNYRPISVIGVIAKVFEKCLKTRITEFFDKHKILSDRQFGFRTGVSTSDAIFEVTKTVYESIDRNKKVIAMFVDLEKAFDTVSHDILLEKLEQYGVRGIAADLIRTYLKDRTQIVKVNNVKSNAKIINYGVPQGTVLGPLLFNIYINEILTLKFDSDTKVVAYADDTSYIFVDDTWESVTKKAEEGLAVICREMENILLTLNIQKTKFITFTLTESTYPNIKTIKIHKKKNCDHNCDCRNFIEEASKIKYLGVYIDRLLRWDEHIKHIVKLLRCTLPKFKLLVNILSQRTIFTIYFALAQSILEYGIVGWGAAYRTHLESLETTQKFILRIIMKKDRLYPSHSLFNEAKVYTIGQLFHKNALLMIYKHRVDYVRYEHTYSTRSQSQNQIKTPKIQKTISQKHASHVGIRLYNALPQEIKRVSDLRHFVRKIKNTILNS